MVATRQDVVWRNAGISFFAGVAGIFVPVAILPHIEPQYLVLAKLFSGAGTLFVLYGAVRLPLRAAVSDLWTAVGLMGTAA